MHDNKKISSLKFVEICLHFYVNLKHKINRSFELEIDFSLNVINPYVFRLNLIKPKIY